MTRFAASPCPGVIGVNRWASVSATRLAARIPPSAIAAAIASAPRSSDKAVAPTSTPRILAINSQPSSVLLGVADAARRRPPFEQRSLTRIVQAAFAS